MKVTRVEQRESRTCYYVARVSRDPDLYYLDGLTEVGDIFRARRYTDFADAVDKAVNHDILGVVEDVLRTLTYTETSHAGAPDV